MKQNISALKDGVLIEKVKELRREENHITAELLLHLIEVDKRRLYLDLGYSSLFAYMTKGLRYSEPAAYRRISSARCIRRFPEVYGMLLKQQISLTTISMISQDLNESNRLELLPKLKGKSKRDVDLILAELKPQVVVREQIKPLPLLKAQCSKKKALSPNPESNSLFFLQETTAKAPERQQLEQQLEQRQEHKMEEQQFEIRFSASKIFMDKFHRAQAIESRKGPKGMKLEAVFEATLDEYLKKNCPNERAKRREKRKKKDSLLDSTKGTSKERYIPRVTRDAVFVRDNAQCAFVSKEGLRCSCKSSLEIDHIVPFAKGGTYEVSNLRLLCRAHNQLCAEREYGKQYMQRYKKAA